MLVPTITDKIDAARDRRRPASSCRLIANFGNGVDNIDVASAVQRGITVTNTPGVLTEDTADMTMALILAVPRRIAEGARVLPATMIGPAGRRPGCWAAASTGKRLGIVGMGRIGLALARRASAFGLLDPLSQPPPRSIRRIEEQLEATYWDQPRPDAGAHGHRLGQLPAHAGDLSPALGAPPQADEAGCHPGEHGARRDRSTRRRCSRMLEAGELAGAGLDVFEHEPRGQSAPAQARASAQGRGAAAYGLGHPSRAASTWARR